MTISKATLTKDIWTALYGIVTNPTNGISDTRDVPRLATTWVFSKFPDANDPKGKFPGYPIVTFTVSLGAFRGPAIGRGLFESQPIANFDIYARQGIDYNTLVSDLTDKLTSNANLVTTDGLKLFFVNLDTDEPIATSIGDTKVHTGSLHATYNWGGS